jgi:predicted component of type VI protein secretion system
MQVADGRVSRLHCIISLGHAGGQPLLEDCSSNGTFLNHRKLAKAESGVGTRFSVWLVAAGS